MGSEDLQEGTRGLKIPFLSNTGILENWIESQCWQPSAGRLPAAASRREAAIFPDEKKWQYICSLSKQHPAKMRAVKC